MKSIMVHHFGYVATIEEATDWLAAKGFAVVSISAHRGPDGLLRGCAIVEARGATDCTVHRVAA